MITEYENVLVNIIQKKLVGVQLKNAKNGDSGRDFEDKVEELGITVNRKDGVDCKELNWEMKTRHAGATSAQTVGTMSPDDVVSIIDWFSTPIYKKIKKQLRATLDDDSVIIKIELIDFDQEHIQEKLAEAYSYARDQIVKDQTKTYTTYKGGYYGYFENTNPDVTKSLDWRISDGTMDKITSMAKSNFSQLYE